MVKYLSSYENKEKVIIGVSEKDVEKWLNFDFFGNKIRNKRNLWVYWRGFVEILESILFIINGFKVLLKYY